MNRLCLCKKVHNDKYIIASAYKQPLRCTIQFSVHLFFASSPVPLYSYQLIVFAIDRLIVRLIRDTTHYQLFIATTGNILRHSFQYELFAEPVLKDLTKLIVAWQIVRVWLKMRQKVSIACCRQVLYRDIQVEHTFNQKPTFCKSFFMFFIVWIRRN